jgi:hypothetical protein
MRQTVFKRGGDVRLRAGTIYVERPGDEYDPTREPVDAELVKLLGPDRDPSADDHALAFVAKYGVLLGRTAEGSSVSLVDLRRHAADLRNVYSLARALQRIREKSSRAQAEGAEELKAWERDHGSKPIDWIEKTVGKHLEYVRRTLEATETGEFGWRLVSQNLIGDTYARAAEGIARGDRVEICANADCRQKFLVTHGRMRFCTDTCRKHEHHRREDQAAKEARRKSRKGGRS